MRRQLILVTALAGLVLVPAVAGATHFDDVVFTPTCVGFTADLQIRVHVAEPVAQLHVQIDFIDDNDVSVLTIGLDRDVFDADGDGHESISLGDDWNALTDDVVAIIGHYTIRGTLTLTYVDPKTGETTNRVATSATQLECNVVPARGATWSGLRAAYSR